MRGPLPGRARRWIYSGRTTMTAKRALQPRQGILDIAPYVPGRSALAGDGPVIKLSSNETPFGPSPRAVDAYLAEAKNLSRYPDDSSRLLREAIAKLYGLDPARIVCGAGSDELLNLLATAFLGPGDEAIYSRHGFLIYRIVILARGATPLVAPEKDLTADVDEILARVTPATRVVFLANPNNPTGTYLSFDEIKRLRADLPDTVLLVLDAAYAEYVRAVEHNEIWLARMAEDLSALGLSVTPSAANFLLVHFPRANGHSAVEADTFLQSRRIILRRVEEYGFPDALRMTIGTEEENLAVLDALKSFMGARVQAANDRTAV